MNLTDVRLLGKRQTDASFARAANLQLEKHSKNLKPHAGSRAISYGKEFPPTSKLSGSSSGVVAASWLVEVTPRWQFYNPESAYGIERKYTRFEGFGKF